MRLSNKTYTSSKPSILQKIIQLIIRIGLGVIFTFSGFVKAVDPLGYTYKIEDYFHAFGGLFEKVLFLAFPLAVFFIIVELALGLSFLLNVRLKTTIKGAFALMLLMTPLTLYIALTNAVSDCGCFGDALVLTNWETFYKNVVIVALIIILWAITRHHKRLFLKKIEWFLTLLFCLIGVGIISYSYLNLPILDFRPYKVGTYIPDKMVVPEGMPTDEFETILIYSKNGEQKEFTIENYPKDSTWTFVDQKTTLVKKGYTPPIHDFSIIDENGEDRTDEILNEEKVVNLIIMYSLNKTDVEGVKKVNELFKKLENSGEIFIALTGSSESDINKFKTEYNPPYPIWNTEQIALKTVVRANPALVKMKKGTIIGKWNWRNFNKIINKK